MTPEGKIKEQVKAMLKAEEVWYFLPVSNGFGVHGIPDFVCCYKGRSLFIETKKPGGKATPLQLRQKELIEAAGGKWFLVDGPEGLKEVGQWLNDQHSYQHRNVK